MALLTLSDPGLPQLLRGPVLVDDRLRPRRTGTGARSPEDGSPLLPADRNLGSSPARLFEALHLVSTAAQAPLEPEPRGRAYYLGLLLAPACRALTYLRR
jgi:hypothetical protein